MGDIIIVQERGTIPTKWPLGRVTEVHHGQDNMVTVKTSQGIYRRPVTKITVLIPND